MSELVGLWTVETGSYSDHAVHAVFERKEDAKAWAAHLRAHKNGWDRDAYVGEMDLVPSGTAPFDVTTYSRAAGLWDDGRVEMHNMVIETSPALYGPPPARPYVRYVRAPCHKGKGGRVEVRGASEESVNKVLSERIAAWKAGAWAGRGHSEIVEE